MPSSPIPPIDAVLLATPHSLHRAQVIAAAARESRCSAKSRWRSAAPTPAACSTPAAKPACMLAVGHNRRFWPSMRALRDDRGKRRARHASFMSRATTATRTRNAILAGWRLSPEESPGGGLTGAGLHVLDAFTSLLGPARQVYARLNPREKGPPPLDTAMLAIDFESGVTGTLATVRATPFYWRVHVFGTKGSAEVLDEMTMVVRKSGHAPQADQICDRRHAGRRARRLCRCDREHASLSGAGSGRAGDVVGLRGRAESMQIGTAGDLRCPLSTENARSTRYRDIASRLQKDIRLGRYDVGNLLPTETELMARYAQAGRPCAKRLRILTGAGSDRAARGTGSVVIAAEPPVLFSHSVTSLSSGCAIPTRPIARWSRPAKLRPTASSPRSSNASRASTGS